MTVVLPMKGDRVRLGQAIRHCRTLALAAVLIMLVLPALAAEPRVAIGTVERLQGTAEALFGGETRTLATHDPVYLDDRLTTGAGARLLLRLADDTEVTLGAKAALVVDRYVYDPDTANGSLVLRSLEGAFLFKGGRIEAAKEAQVRIVTPVATLGIRGTTAWGGMIDGKYGVLVLDGVVEVATEGGAVTLSKDLGTSIASASAAPTSPIRWPHEKLIRALASVEFKP